VNKGGGSFTTTNAFDGSILCSGSAALAAIEQLDDVAALHAPTKDDNPDVSAPKEPTAEDLAVKATLAKHGLNGAWTCPKEPPKLW
jgi:hypothetical protein